jgi:dCTP deaminase
MGYIDLHHEPEYEQLTCDNEGAYFLQPGQFCLGTIIEYIQLPNNVKAQIDSRSSIGRKGLTIQTAAHIHAGYKGTITLELKNEAPVAIRIFPGDIVAQIVFEYLDEATDNPYNGVYQGQTTTTAPKADPR